jgi:hypothetical protein
LDGDRAEVTRMRAAPAREDGAHVLRLEAGAARPAALAFRTRARFVRIGPFAGCAAGPLGVCMEARLG